ncbi:unnamed protein product [Amoebophrya sp. A120]|nr:unnamed protein product [Amoebophrya sp. A120]|eukprot:GSA120T00025679001.1
MARAHFLLVNREQITKSVVLSLVRFCSSFTRSFFCHVFHKIFHHYRIISLTKPPIIHAVLNAVYICKKPAPGTKDADTSKSKKL